MNFETSVKNKFFQQANKRMEFDLHRENQRDKKVAQLKKELMQKDILPAAVSDPVLPQA